MSDAQPSERPSDPSARGHDASSHKGSARWIKWRWLRVAIKVSLCLLLVLILTYMSMALYFGIRLKATLDRMHADGEPLTMQEIRSRYRGPAEENAAHLYRDAAAHIDVPSVYASSWAERKHLADVRKALAADADALRLVIAASRRPGCQFEEEEYPPHKGTLSRLSDMRRLSRLLVWATVAATEDGQINEAYRRVIAGLRMGEHLAMNPLLITQLVSYSIRNLAQEGARVVLAKAPPPLAVREVLATLLVERDLKEEFARCMVGERAMGLTISQGPQFPAPRPLRRAWQFGYLRVINRFTAQAAQPIRSTGKDESAVVESLPWYCLFGKMLWDPLVRAKVGRDTTIAKFALLHIAIGLEVYRREAGSYPGVLATLRTELKWSVPEDIFSGRDYVYRREGDRFLLYSLGPDLDDDGGRPLGFQIYMPGDEASVMKSEDGDLMWVPYGRKAEYRARAGYPPTKEPSHQ